MAFSNFFGLKIDLDKISERMNQYVQEARIKQRQEQENTLKQYIQSVQVTRKKAPLGYNQNEYMKKIERTYRGYVDIGRKYGLNEAADNLEHFLNNSGTPRILDSFEVRKKDFIKKGEKLNNQRFQNSFVNKGKISEQLLSLKSGQERRVHDNWDYEIGRASHILHLNADEAFSTGTSFLKSVGDFKTKRREDTIYINGVVSHKWQDLYDFKSAGDLSLGASVLEKAGRAKIFPISSEWKQKLKGTVNIRNKTLYNPQFVLEDYNDED